MLNAFVYNFTIQHTYVHSIVHTNSLISEYTVIMSTNKKTIIHWFRKGLRVHDNPALVRAFDIVRANPEKYCLRPIFILDPHIRKWLKVGPNRWRFLQESLQQLNENLLNCNTRLYVVRGNPQEVFPILFDTWNVEELTFESDIEPYSIERDNDIEVKAFEYGVKVNQFYSHTVYNPQLVLEKNGDKAPVTYQKFLSIVEKIKVAPSLKAPVLLPDETHPLEDNLEKKNKTCYEFPTLDELVPDQSHLGPRKFPGGETEALSRMEMYLQQTEYICKFEKPNTSPNSLQPSTTVLSPYLKFGCLSSRLFFHKLNDVLHKNPKHSKPPTSLLGQLMWREFYYTAAASDPNFDKMVGNKFSYQIPWQCNTEYLEAWSYGKTGYPFIDAIMRQLRQEGWIHHLARHAVACFLTRGDLWISWEEGQKVFEELLLDADWALNAGNWMWLSASAFFYKYFRVYSPVSFGKKTDPEGKYIKRYCPELKKYPAGIIYEPWKASLKDQKEYGCVLGKDYPHRIVIHETIHKENLSKMAKAYKFNKELKESGVEILQGKRKIETPANSFKTKKNRR